MRARWAAALVLPLLMAHPVLAQERCPDGQISFIFVDNHSIFDPDDLVEDRPFRWGYRLANALHMRTRESFIRSELLFREGDCYRPHLLEDSERILRDHRFISQSDVYGVRQLDGSWHVVVDTKDEWTTRVNLRVQLSDGLRLQGADLREENVLGRGIRAGLFFREHEEQRDLGAELFTPRLLGTRTDVGVRGGRTRIGTFFEESLQYPFVGEVGRVAARQIYLRRDEVFPYALGTRRPVTGEITHLLLPYLEERFELTLAARLGSPGNLTTFGLGVSNETLEFPSFPDDVEVARDGNFGERETASAEMADLLRPHTLHSAATRLNLLVGQRNIRFVTRSGLDALTGVQDVALGTDLGLTIGRSAPSLSAGDGRPVDLYARLRTFVGAANDRLVAHASAILEGRQVFQGGSRQGWSDVLGEGDLLVYWQPPVLSGHTFLLRVEGAGAWNLEQPFQLTLGGGTGLRGYDDWHFPAAQRLLVNVEDRIHVRWPLPDLFDFGFTFFGDVGRGWPGDVPFAVDSGWRGTVGAGLRVGFPAGTRGVVRADVAFPLGPDTGPGDVIVRIGLRDTLGILAGTESRQLARSRRGTVGPDLFIEGRR